jgi:hypothetical protein
MEEGSRSATAHTYRDRAGIGMTDRRIHAALLVGERLQLVNLIVAPPVELATGGDHHVKVVTTRHPHHFQLANAATDHLWLVHTQIGLSDEKAKKKM